MKTHYAVGLAVMSSVAGAGLVETLHAQMKPKAYVIAETEVTDPASFGKYAQGVGPILAQAGARFTANGGKTFVINGAEPKRIALIEWDTFKQGQAFYESEAYRKLTPDRDKGGNFRAVLVEGLPPK
jgi:uncharacterized protein (DUF1330 family)